MGLSVHAEEKKYKALEGIVHDAVSILSGIIGVQIDSPWQGHAESVPTTASASSAKPVDRLVELNSDGSMKTPGAILEGMQMKVGSCVRRRKDKMECEILAIDTGVKLKSLTDGRALRGPPSIPSFGVSGRSSHRRQRFMRSRISSHSDPSQSTPTSMSPTQWP